MSSTGQIDEGPLAAGARVEAYKIRQLLHTGLHGSIYSAIDPTSGQKVAIKVLHPHLRRDAARTATYLAQMKRVATLDQPGLLRVRSAGQLPAPAVEDNDGGNEPPLPYVIYDFMHGQTLTELIDEHGQGMPAADARPLLAAVADALAALHALKLTHGDLKPDNVFLTPRPDGSWPPEVSLADLGIAGLLLPDTCTVEATEASPLAASPYYLSPEQCAGQPAAAATDVYALGVIAYQLLTGRLPHSAARPAEVMRLHRESTPRPPSARAEGLDADSEAIVLKAMAVAPADRFASAAELGEALRRAVAATAPPDGDEGDDRGDAPPPAGPDADAPPPAAEDADAPPPAAEDAAAAADADGEAETPRTVEVDLPDHQIETHPPGRSLLPPMTPKTAEVRRVGDGQRLGVWLLLWLALIVAGGTLVYRLTAGRWPWKAAERAATAPGMLEVSTTPQGAVVYLNRVPWHRKSPAAIPVQRGRPYDLYIFKHGHLPWRRRIALGVDEGTRRLEVKLVQAERWGTVQITTSARADIFWDSRRVGTQTTSVNLAEVRADVPHRVRIVGPGFRTLRRRVRVEAGKVKVLKFDMERVDTPAPPN